MCADFHLPNDCHVLVSVPTNLPDFQCAWSRSGKSDFLMLNLNASAKDLDLDSAWLRYKYIAGQFSHSLSQIRKNGALVTTSATSVDLISSFKSMPVICLVGHWRGARVYPWHITSLPRAIEVLEKKIEDLLTVFPKNKDIQKLLALVHKYSQSKASDDSNIFCKLLNSIISGFPSLYRMVLPNIDPINNQDNLESINRDAIDSLLGDAIEPGNAIELSDMSIKANDFLSIIPRDFDGELDLAVCHSEYVLSVIKRSRQFCCIGRERKVRILMVLKLCEMTIWLLNRERMMYSDALSAICDQLANNKFM